MSLAYKLLTAMSPVCAAFEEMFLVDELFSVMSPVCAAFEEMFFVYLVSFLSGIYGVPSELWGDYMQ